MKEIKCQKQHYKKIAIFGFVIFLIAGTLDNLISSQPWYFIYFQTFVFTAGCTFYCAILLCNSIGKISQYPRFIYYSLFIILVVIGVLLGVITASLILKQKIIINRYALIFSLLFGFVSSVVITAYMFLKDNLEEKISRIKEVEIENERLKRIELEARMSSLQAKLNPHFLFNTLNSTAALIYDNPQKAEESIIQLSDLYRKIFSISNQNFIMLQEEIELIEDMLELEKLRFEDNLSYLIDIPEVLKNAKIPGLLIEPLVENVIKHVHGKNQQKIHIDIIIKKDNDKLSICVEDNGTGFDVGKADLGFGLYSIQERLRLLFGDEGGMNIDSTQGQGTKVTIWLPIGD
jgi:two-component system LytT family sensor kinase